MLVAKNGYSDRFADDGCIVFNHQEEVLKKTYSYIVSYLTLKERRSFHLQVGLDIFLNIADILFLAGVIWLLNFYSLTARSAYWQSVYEQKFFLPILLFFVGYSLKNLCGYYILRAQYDFVYRVASRLSSEKMDLYLSSDL